MRLLYVCADRGVHVGGTKGASVHVHELTRALAAAGADVVVAAASVVDGAPAPPGVRVTRVPSSALDALAHDVLPDVMYERVALHATTGSRAARALGIPHLVELNAPLVEEAARYRTLERPDDAVGAELEVLTNAAIVLPVSAPLAAHARERGARRVEVVPNAVDLDRFAAQARHDAGGRPVAVLAGNLRPWHGADVVAGAWRAMDDGAPALLVVGDGHGREELAAVGAIVTGALPYDDVPALVARAHIGLVPYVADAPPYFSPLKLFEYLAAGLAVVAADVAGVTEIVDRSTAVVVPPGDAGAMADAVRALAADPDRRAEMGAAGRALVAAHHTWASRAARVLDLARDLAGTVVA